MHRPRHAPYRLSLLAAALLAAGCASLPREYSDSRTVSPNETAAIAAAAAQAAAREAAVAPAGMPGVRGNDRPATAAAAAATAAAQAAQLQRPFEDVVRDAKESKGLFNVWQHDDRVWIEIAPDQFDKPYFFSVNLSRGLGEKWIYAGMMGDSQIVEFHRVGNNVQLIAKNTDFFASEGKPQARTVAESFSDSLLSVAPVASQPHPERKSVLIDASMLLLSDIPAANGMLERAFHQPYNFDGRNSNIVKTHATPNLLGVDVNAHYSLNRVVAGAGPDGPQPPATIPDVRSLFLGFYYNFAKLPDEPMRPRVADDRIGYFMTSRFDFGNETRLTPRVNYINRWRLEKKDPDAVLSEPKKPIVYWLDRNIPEKYRPTIEAGVLEWNKAFERIGFKNAIQVRVQPDDADFDTVDARHASIRWMATARPAFGAIGPIQVDPRTGEILDADILIDPVRVRNRRAMRVEQIAGSSSADAISAFTKRPDMLCMQPEYAAQEMNFALDLLEARGEIDADGPEAEKFALDDLKDSVMHEVGHTLGLRHNFRASTVYTQAQLDDPQFTKTHGVSGSVMEYNAVNIAPEGKPQGAYGMTTLGPYDYWAIQYGYEEIAPTQEKAELHRIAARSSEPLLAFATDEDASFAIDPEANQSDLGSDPLEFAQRRFDLVREMWARWQNRELKPDESYTVYRRIVERGLVAMTNTSTNVAKYIGGVTTLRDHAGSQRAPLMPVDAQRQRLALKVIADGLFSADSFKFKPEFMQRVQVDWLDRNDIYDVGLSTPNVDYSLSTQVLNAQRKVLSQLMSEAVAQRVLDSEVKLDDPRKALHLADVYDTLKDSIWSELKTGHDISPLRRNLQRDHLARIANALLRPSGSMPADARALLREEAKELRKEIATAQKRHHYSKEVRAHLDEAQTQLDEALKAPLVRQAV